MHACRAGGQGGSQRGGWAFVAVRGSGPRDIDGHGIEALSANKPIHEEFGKVDLNKDSSRYLGSVKGISYANLYVSYLNPFLEGSSHAAELTAIGEGLIWLTKYVRDIIESHNNNRDSIAPFGCVILKSDCQEAIQLIKGESNPSQHVQLVNRCKGILVEANSSISKLQKIYFPNSISTSTSLVNFLVVKGHGFNTWNNRAHTLAKKGVPLID